MIQPRTSNTEKQRHGSSFLASRICRTVATFMVLSIFLILPTGRTTRADTVYPPDRQFANYSVPNSGMPGYMSQVVNTSLGTTTQRISDQAAFGSSYQFLHHHYSKTEPWNSTGSLLLLSYAYPAPLLDGQTYRFLRWIHQPGDAQWAHTNPNNLYGVTSDSLVVMHPQTEPDWTYHYLHTFTQYNSPEVTIGYGEGNMSNDDHWIVITGSYSSGGVTDYGMTVYDLANNVEVATYWFGPQQPDWASISPLGDYVVVNWSNSLSGTGRNRGVEIFDRGLNFIRQITPDAEHADMGLDASGNEVYVTMGGLGGITSFRLSDNAAIVVLPSGINGGHISCRNMLYRPGWCYFSDDDNYANLLGYDQEMAVKLDGSRTVEVFALQHDSSNIEYGAQAFGVPNPDGTRVLFDSDWYGGPSAPAYDYVAQVLQGSPPAAVPSNTSVSTPSATATSRPSPTSTPLPTLTNTPAPTSTQLSTPTNTRTSTPFPVLTNTPTSTPLPTLTATPTPVHTPTTSAAPTSTATQVIASETPPSSYVATVLNDHPSLYYRLDQSSGAVASDSSGNGRVGNYAGAVAFGVSGTTTDGDRAVSLPGRADTYITYADPGIRRGASFSLEIWAKLGLNGHGQSLFGNAATGTTLRYETSIGPFQRFGFNTNAVDSASLYTTQQYPSGSWHHVVYVWDSLSATESIYIDGRLDRSRVSPPYTPNVAGPGRIGYYNTSWPMPIDGTVDEAAIYPTALSAAQVQSHYLAGIGRAAIGR